MKIITFLSLLIVCMAVILAAGCTSQNDSTVTSTGISSPTSSSTVAQVQDSIVGLWRGTDGSNDYRLQFNADGTTFYSNNGGADVTRGTWVLKGTLDNGNVAYTVTGANVIETYVFDKTKNDIYSTSYPTLLLTPYQGNVGLITTTSVPTLAQTPVLTAIPTTVIVATSSPVITLGQVDPIVGTYTCDAGTAGYSQVTFNVDGTFVEYFNLAGEAPVQATGTWQYNNGVYHTALTTGATNVWVITPNGAVKNENALIYSPGTAHVQSQVTQATAPTATVSTKVTSFSGSGDDVQSFTATGDGIRIFSMSYNGGHNFAVWLEDAQGNHIDLLANKIGSYSGAHSERLGQGTYYLDVTASGPWTITLTSP